MSTSTSVATDTASQPTPSTRPKPARVIHRRDFEVLPGPPNAPFVRKQCFDDGHVWIGEVTTEPGTASPWHHHGDYDTFFYCLEGQARLEFEDPRTEPLDVHADGSVVVIPKGLIHREINTGDVRNRGIVVRVGFGLPVFPVDPASIGR